MVFLGKAIKLLSKGLVMTNLLISEVMPFEQWGEAFNKYSIKSNGN